MRNLLRAVVLLIWRIWARYNSRRIMRVPVPKRIFASLCRIFFFGICLGDRGRLHNRAVRSGISHIPARHLTMKGGAEHKKADHHC